MIALKAGFMVSNLAGHPRPKSDDPSLCVTIHTVMVLWRSSVLTVKYTWLYNLAGKMAPPGALECMKTEYLKETSNKKMFDLVGGDHATVKDVQRIIFDMAMEQCDVLKMAFDKFH